MLRVSIFKSQNFTLFSKRIRNSAAKGEYFTDVVQDFVQKRKKEGHAARETQLELHYWGS